MGALSDDPCGSEAKPRRLLQPLPASRRLVPSSPPLLIHLPAMEPHLPQWPCRPATVAVAVALRLLLLRWQLRPTLRLFRQASPPPRLSHRPLRLRHPLVLPRKSTMCDRSWHSGRRGAW